MITIGKEFRFEASHILPKHPGVCSRLHGHSWFGIVSVSGPVDPETGFVMDFGNLKSVIENSITSVLDHRHLGTWSVQHLPFNTLWAAAALPRTLYPSSENLLEWMVRQLVPHLPNLAEVRLKETCTSEAIWRP